MKKILFVTYGGGHSRIIIELIKSGYFKSFDVNILALNNAVKDFISEGIPFQTLNDFLFLFEEHKEKLDKYYKIIESDFYIKSDNVTLDIIQVYLSLAFLDLELTGKSFSEIIELFKKHGKKVLSPELVMKRIIEFISPVIVIVSCGVRYEKASVLASNQLGIKNLRIDDILGEDEYIVTPLSYFTVVNVFGKNQLISRYPSIDPNNIFITGNPNLLPIEITNNLDFAPDLVFFTQPLFKETFLIINKLIEICDELSYKLVVKIHPSEDIHNYQIFQSHSSNFILTKSIDTSFLLKKGRVIITINSTVGLQAALMDKDLIVVFLENHMNNQLNYSSDYSQYGIALKVTDLSQMKSAILNYQSTVNPEILSIREKRHAFSMPENPSLEIFNIVKYLIQHEK